MNTPEHNLNQAATKVSQWLNTTPDWAIVSGSGQSQLAERFHLKKRLPYADIPNFSLPTVKGHGGEIAAGKIDSTPVMLFTGRRHYYEDPAPGEVVFSVRLCALLGVPNIVLLNSAGGLNSNFRPGDLMALRDVVNLQFRNPLIGPNDEKMGPRFPDMSEPFDRALTDRLRDAARSLKIKLHHGVYAAMLGPTYETRAEVKMLQWLGADAVGMSTAPETIAARHAGMRVVGVSCITNSLIRPAKTTHQEVLENAARANLHLSSLLRKFIADN